MTYASMRGDGICIASTVTHHYPLSPLASLSRAVGARLNEQCRQHEQDDAIAHRHAHEREERHRLVIWPVWPSDQSGGRLKRRL